MKLDSGCIIKHDSTGKETRQGMYQTKTGFYGTKMLDRGCIKLKQGSTGQSERAQQQMRRRKKANKAR